MMVRKKDTVSNNRRPWKPLARSKVSILQVFRSAHAERDAKKASLKTDDGDTEITQRSKQRRDGVSDSALQTHLQADLTALLNTIRLDAVVSLEDAPFVARSIVNYGFRDLSNVSASDINTTQIAVSIRQSLINHEPRLIPETVEVRINDHEGNKHQRLSLSVSAEIMGDPVDVPLDFDAEIDLGAGKLKMSNLRVQS